MPGCGGEGAGPAEWAWPGGVASACMWVNGEESLQGERGQSDWAWPERRAWLHFVGVAKQEESPEGAWPRRRGCGLKGGVALKGGTDCNRGRGLKGGVALTGGTAYTGGYKRGVASKGAWRQAAYKGVWSRGGRGHIKGRGFQRSAFAPKGAWSHRGA